MRLLQDIQGFGRKHAIIRVKPGRMRNYWFPKAQAEYMTRQRFRELGLSEAAIGVRDRTFGVRLLLEDDADADADNADDVLVEDGPRKSKKDTLTLPPEETLALLQALLPPRLTFWRRPIVNQPPAARSPSLAINAVASEPEPMPEPLPDLGPGGQGGAIFGSVSASDILAAVKERLLEADPAQGGRVALEPEGVTILGLEKEGDDRIKRLGTYKVLVSASKDLEPVVREVWVTTQ